MPIKPALVAMTRIVNARMPDRKSTRLNSSHPSISYAVFCLKKKKDAFMTAADVLIECLIDWGVEVVFGLPGDGINGIMESLRTHQDKIRFVQVRHEEAASFM